MALSYDDNVWNTLVENATVFYDGNMVFLAAVMDLCGRKIVGMSMDSRMTKQLTIDVLKDAVNHSGNVNGCILHSDNATKNSDKSVVGFAKFLMI